MSLKDSMMRGLAMYGMSAMAKSAPASSKVLADILNAADNDTIAR
ncbi:hypothetical protein DSM100688_1939 [Bifidobacterium ramosum]|uniref:Uncharacterized protein n=1 Tax=Bifidobacterium ramosum TaxID=1798158 RepID=A0A6L4WY64_9BIFI|nr:hypothetical protein [Bifidobacterium ramosum]KAB8286988.1 hypothetical protein DSM100688_1939 [Bifidobacterium ramosum]